MPIRKIVLYVTLICVIGIALFVLVSAIWNLFLLKIATAFGLRPEYLANLSYLLGFAILFMPKRFLRINRPLTLTATQVIFAPIQEVWDQVMPRARTDHYLPTTPVIEAIEGEVDMFNYVIPAVQNGPMKGQTKLRNRVVTKAEPNYLAMFLENGSEIKGLGIDGEASEYKLDMINEETTRVTHHSTVSHISPMFLITLLFVSPVKDSLRRLKSVCEGTPDTSWAGRITKQLEDGQKTDLEQDATAIMITVAVVMTIVLFGIVGFVLTLAPSA